MGLLIKLQNGDTALKSLKFGKDRPGGGDSGQPYIQKPIDKVSSPANTDFILRGGINAPLNAAEDVARLTKYMFNPKSPSGLLFIAKQNLLSRVAPKTETSFGLAYAGGGLNAGVYNPLSTIAQAGVGFAGIHLNKQGIDPTGLIPGLSIRKYSDTIKSQSDNRLVALSRLTKKTNFNSIKNYNLNIGNNIIEYGGGPGSVLGVGKTYIRFATDNEGVNLKSLSTSSPTSWTIKDIYDVKLKNRDSITGEDFRTKLSKEAQKTTSVSLNYSTINNIERNFNLGNPGQRGDVSDYTRGKINKGDSLPTALDKITAYPIYKSEVKESRIDSELNDLIPFRIAILNNENEIKGPFAKFIHFRAFIDSFSDSYSADWDKVKYMGRAENFYKYKGFERDISLSFTVVAQSKDELSIMYDKLNFLASSLAPEYLDSGLGSGYMAGNIAYLTLGDYIIEQPGIITSLTFDIPEDSSWEVGIKSNGEQYDSQDKIDDKVPRRLPHMIKVTGFKFIPIHTFRAEKVRWQNTNPGDKQLIGNTFQKYIDPLKIFTTPPPPIDSNITANISTSQGLTP